MLATNRSGAIAYAHPSETGGAVRRLAGVAPLAIVLTTAATALLVLWGPVPVRPLSHNDLTDLEHTLIEPTDRLVLVSWWLIAVFLTVALLVRSRYPRLKCEPSLAVQWVVALAAVGLAVAAVLLDSDQAGLWPPVDLAYLVLGLSLTVVIMLQWRSQRRISALIGIVLLTALVVLTVPALLQTPAGARDFYSFQFTADEMAAPAIGRVPYGNYAPQYSALLGLPIAPWVSAMPQRALTLIMAWFILLQVVTLAIAVTLPTLAGGRRFLAGSALAVVVPMIATAPNGFSAATYFAGLPLRLFLPMATLALAYVLLQRSSQVGGRTAIRFAGLGVVTGATVINNPDFGLPTLASVLLAVILAIGTWRERLRATMLAVAGAVASGLMYAAWASAMGAPISADYLLVFQRVFGAEGYFSVAMQGFGLHVATAALFISATAIGIGMLVMPAGRKPSSVRRQSLLLTLSGTWSLLSLSYFAGRSYTATLMGGHALQIGLVTAAFLPLIRGTLRGVRTVGWRGSPFAVGSAALGFVAMVWCFGGLSRVNSPPVYFAAAKPGDVPDHLARQTAQLINVKPRGASEQLLNMPALTSLLTGVPTHPIVNNPMYLILSRHLAGQQCQEIWAQGTKVLIVARATAAGMAKAPACQAMLGLDRIDLMGPGSDLVAVAIRR